jgi:hypothetical protein
MKPKTKYQLFRYTSYLIHGIHLYSVYSYIIFPRECSNLHIKLVSYAARYLDSITASKVKDSKAANAGELPYIPKHSKLT